MLCLYPEGLIYWCVTSCTHWQFRMNSWKRQFTRIVQGWHKYHDRNRAYLYMIIPEWIIHFGIYGCDVYDECRSINFRTRIHFYTASLKIELITAIIYVRNLKEVPSLSFKWSKYVKEIISKWDLVLNTCIKLFSYMNSRNKLINPFSHLEDIFSHLSSINRKLTLFYFLFSLSLAL